MITRGTPISGNLHRSLTRAHLPRSPRGSASAAAVAAPSNARAQAGWGAPPRSLVDTSPATENGSQFDAVLQQNFQWEFQDPKMEVRIPYIRPMIQGYVRV